MHKAVFVVAIGATTAIGAWAQGMQRTATITGGRTGDSGKCTVQVVVDGAAEVEIRGNSATLRDISGQPPQFRRFDCTSAMPANPANFRFSGIDGRGRQELVRDPSNGGTAVIRIEDEQGGAETYTFELSWNAGGRNGGQQYPTNGYPNGAYPNNPPNGDSRTGNQYPNRNDSPASRDTNRGYDQSNQGARDANNGYGERNRNADENRPDDRARYDDRDRSGDATRYGDRDRSGDANRAQFGADQAVRACQDAVSNEAYRRFRTREFSLGRTDLSPDGDAITGTLELSNNSSQGQRYRFTCSMNSDSGRIGSVQIRPMERRSR